MLSHSIFFFFTLMHTIGGVINSIIRGCYKRCFVDKFLSHKTVSALKVCHRKYVITSGTTYIYSSTKKLTLFWWCWESYSIMVRAMRRYVMLLCICCWDNIGKMRLRKLVARIACGETHAYFASLKPWFYQPCIIYVYIYIYI